MDGGATAKATNRLIDELDKLFVRMHQEGFTVLGMVVDLAKKLYLMSPPTWEFTDGQAPNLLSLLVPAKPHPITPASRATSPRDFASAMLHPHSGVGAFEPPTGLLLLELLKLGEDMQVGPGLEFPPGTTYTQALRRILAMVMAQRMLEDDDVRQEWERRQAMVTSGQ